jgi:hypothetical protein
MRSPAYPVFGLSEAVKKANDLWVAQRKADGHLDSVIHALGYNGRNGASLRATAALNHFGLTEETGAKDNRRIRLSELAQDILHLIDDDPKRLDALKKAALSPAIHQVLWERYQHNLPSDTVIKAFLVRDKSYNDSATSDVIANYRDSFELAQLGKEKKNEIDDWLEEEEATQPEMSDLPRSNHLRPQSPKNPELAKKSVQELPILVDHGQVARIPFPMSEEAFDLLLGTLNLWKKKLIQNDAAE